MLIYPAIFHRTIEGGYIVVFPDFDNGATEGQTLEQAMEMAEDYIGTYLYDDFIKGKELPKASDINEISIEIPEDEKEFYIEGESFKTLVSLDMMKYVNECKSATVRKNVTIPSWLNEMGKNHNLNFSNLLQEAIKKELDTHKSGVIAGRNHVDINTDTINNTGKGFIYSGGTMDLTAKQGINNTGATIKAVKSIQLDTPVVNNKNVALGVKRVSDGITKNPDKLKVTDPHHKLEGQVFDKSEFPYADDKSGYGTPHVKPVKTAEDEAYNKEMNKNENRINQFTIIRSEAEQTHKKITNDHGKANTIKSK